MPNANVPASLTIEAAELVFLNFGGKESRFNDRGERTFCVFLEPGLADQMLRDGWNVKGLASREEDEPDRPYIQVKVNFQNKPPLITVISSTGRTVLNEDTVEMLDYADIQNVDLIINPYHWELNGKTGVKAYLKTMFVTLNEDELQRKYAQVGE